MTGEEIFDKYVNEGGEYAQLLLTLHISLGDQLFPILKKAEDQGKKLEVNQDDELLIDGIVMSDISLV
ncbi:MAG: hypothetical protein IE931_05600 [Sphingobacteriales bacterium]|nr:hypothetical protein [Sphingobacteriales bacterium]